MTARDALLLAAVIAVLSVSWRDDAPRVIRCATAMGVTCGSAR